MTRWGSWQADPEWARVGHALGPVVRAVIESQGGMLVVHGSDERYVQMHAVPGEGCYVEADSGELSGAPLTAQQHRRLGELGWSAPVEGPGNYWTERGAPFDVYALVLLLVGTLAEVYDGEPGAVSHDRFPCVCGHAAGEGPP